MALCKSEYNGFIVLSILLKMRLEGVGIGIQIGMVKGKGYHTPTTNKATGQIYSSSSAVHSAGCVYNSCVVR